MEIDQLKTFLAVGTFGGFHRAAEVLFITQPAVSARIKSLEQSLGVKLFERGRGRLVLSAAGRALRPQAEHLMKAVADARRAVQEPRSGSGGPLHISAALSICTYLLPDILKRFRGEHPKVSITVRSGHSREVLEMVLREEVEIGLARSLHHPSVETLSLRDDPLILVAHRGHVPPHAHRVRLEEVASRPLIFFDRGSSDWTLTHGLFRRAGLVANVALEVDTIEAAKRMVERGLGISFLPLLAVAQEVRQGRLVAIQITDAEPLSRSLDVIHSRHRPLSKEAMSFLRTLRTAVMSAGASIRHRPRRRRVR